MTSRKHDIETFLNENGWGSAKRTDLAGDASNRRYERVQQPDGTRAVLMDAPPEADQSVTPFVKIARYLGSIGLSAPDILAMDEPRGLILLEDLGDDLLARYVQTHPEDEHQLYAVATDVLVDLHSASPPDGLATYGPEIMTNMAALAYGWYLRGCNQPFETREKAFKPRFRAILEEHVHDTSVLIQRDYHAENLLWLPSRTGSARIGLLDFQDAVRGHPAYDVASLLSDVRRDVAPELEAAMLARYIDRAGEDEATFRTAYALLAAQRNAKIAGIFTRLSVRDGKHSYRKWLPRTYRLLRRDLAHPALAPVARWFDNHLPRDPVEDSAET